MIGEMKLARVNNGLLSLIILINAYIILAPFMPVAAFWWENRGGTRQRELIAKIQQAPEQQAVTKPSPPEANQVIIPAMLLDQPILEGPVSATYSILAKGIWRWPRGSTPDKGGNTTLIGHRFTYTNPRGVLYYLNKVTLGDEIGLIWDNDLYTYKVSSITEIPPTDTAIENNTTDARLTIFTCTPVWLPKDR
jgi:sortase A